MVLQYTRTLKSKTIQFSFTTDRALDKPVTQTKIRRVTEGEGVGDFLKIEVNA